MSAITRKVCLLGLVYFVFAFAFEVLIHYGSGVAAASLDAASGRTGHSPLRGAVLWRI